MLIRKYSIFSLPDAAKYKVSTEQIWEYLVLSINLEGLLLRYRPFFNSSSIANKLRFLTNRIKAVENGHFNLKQLVEEATFTVNETISKLPCMFADNFANGDCDQHFTSVLTSLGVCQAFNSLPNSTLVQSNLGYSSGLFTPVRIELAENSGEIFFFFFAIISYQSF